MKSLHDRSYRLLITLLKDERKRQGLTQTEMGARIGFDQTFVSKYEARQRRLDIVELRSICEALGLDFVGFVRDFEKRLEEQHEAGKGRRPD